MSTKITRKSYKRNKLVLGASLFAGVALVSTGFAAWVITTSVNKEATGNVQVGTVENNSVVIKLDSSTPGNFRFDVDKLEGYTSTDNVLTIAGKADELASLSVKITGSVTVGASVTDFQGLNFKMDSNSGIDAAKTVKYISTPECYNADKVLGVTSGTKLDNISDETADGLYQTNTDRQYVFKYTVSFDWGSYFSGKDSETFNPAQYLVGAYNWVASNKTTDGQGVFAEDVSLPKKFGSEDEVQSGDDVIELSSTVLEDLKTKIDQGKVGDKNEYKITVSAKTGA